MGFFKVLTASLATLAVVNAGELIAASKGAEVVPSSYIVVMNENVSTAEIESHRSRAASLHARSMNHARSLNRQRNLSGPGKQFDIHGMKGYTASFDDDTVKELASDPAVRHYTIRADFSNVLQSDSSVEL